MLRGACARCLARGREAEQNGGEQAQSEREDKGLGAYADLVGERQAGHGRHQTEHGAQTQTGEQDPADNANAREHQILGQKLPHDLTARSAGRDANGKLVSPGGISG